MNLIYISEQINSLVIDPKSWRPTQTGQGNSGNVLIGNLKAFRTMLARCEGLPGLSLIVSQLTAMPFYGTAHDQVSLSLAEAQNLERTVNRFDDGIAFGKRFMDQLGIPRIDKDSIFVRFSDAKELSSLSEQIDILEKSLRQTVLEPEIKGKIEIVAVDNGSVWLFLFLGSAAAVRL